MAPKDDPAELPPGDENGFDGFAEGPEGDQPMSFFDHLAELRKRLIRAALGVLVGFGLSFAFVRQILDVLKRPLNEAWKSAELPGGPNLQVLEIQGALMVDIRVGVFAGIILALPVLFYQLWMFISPGLYKKEKQYVIPFVAASVILFAIGTTFAYFVVLPFAIRWLLTYPGGNMITKILVEYQDVIKIHHDLALDAQVVYQLELSNYVKGATRILLSFGLVFEFPLVIAFLAAAGVVNHRMLLQYWKVAILIIFVLAAFLTPPEPVTQAMMALPMVVLFFLSVIVAYFLNPVGPPEEVEEDDDEDDEDDADNPFAGLFGGGDEDDEDDQRPPIG